MLIVVCSSFMNFEARQTIRETWGNTTEFNYPYFQKFHAQYKDSYLDINSKTWQNKSLEIFKLKYLITGDIIQENFLDTYNNLTLKSIFVLKYVKNNCENKVKYVMKCDDDTFINVPNLIHVLLGGTIPVYNSTIAFNDESTVNAKSSKNRIVENSKYLLMGLKFCNARPITDVTSKWYTPNYMYSGEFFPNYISGSAYLMSEAVVRKLYDASLSTPIFYIEDVYITGIVADKIKVRRTNHPLFFFSSNDDHCSLRGMISQHQGIDMKTAYNFITNSTIKCA
ncbi:unnamed protein product [Diamesa hyperborea]